ncbi:MAG: hypothetical protein JSS72_04625 [Armatimonadetes bacterium]|nr:hypothetical protein [Armatimonadota bacterium]
MIRTAGLALGCLFAASACSQSVTLRYHYTPGTTLNYKMSIQVNMQVPSPMNSTMTMGFKTQVLKVAPNGDATLKVSTSSPKMVSGGKEAPVNTPPQTATMTITPRGEVKGMSTQMGSMQQFQTQFPSGPVHRGSTWETSANQGGVKIDIKNKVVSISSSGGHQIVLISATGAGKMNTGGARGTIGLDISETFDATAGVIKSVTGNIRTDLTLDSGGGKPMKMGGTQKMSLTLVNITKS